ncbi:MAG: hypothetical protein EP329_15730 [Deltaproteobacteria bacterium]|nr:MAG: hypothetical protein EP329_15730 [Deltaproteobacteria bacterium]
MRRAIVTTEAAVLGWMARLSDDVPVHFPRVGPNGGWRFQPVASEDRLSFAGYRPTILPPGKLFAPVDEVLFNFVHLADGSFRASPVYETHPRVLAGVRPCDVRAIGLMDQVNREGTPDPHYLARRGATTLVAYRCAEPCSESCFCGAVGSLDSDEGADLFLTPLPAEDGEAPRVLVEARSDAGETLMEHLDGDPAHDPAALVARYRAARPEPFGRKLPGDPAGLPDALARAERSHVWRDHTERCLSCGTCNLVCPTCYCFDTHDEVDLADPDVGRRCRDWDSCMLNDFAVVADGHDFRRDVAARQAHRVKRKFKYLNDKFEAEAPFCVGCGRCGTQCTVGIDIFDIASDVLREHGGAA